MHSERSAVSRFNSGLFGAGNAPLQVVVLSFLNSTSLSHLQVMSTSSL